MILRPHFTVRALGVFVTLVCVYFGAWEATKKWGVPTVGRRLADPYEGGFDVWSPVPFVIICDDNNEFLRNPSRHYYIWLLGPKFRLPFEST